MRYHSPLGSLDDLHPPAVFARIETRDGYPALEHTDHARAVVMALLRTVSRYEVEPVAYCLLPDHIHLLLASRTEGADPRAALRRWKQVSGAAHRERAGRTLWKPRSAEWSVEDMASLWGVAAYLVMEPVRRRVVRTVDDYRWLSAPPEVMRQLASRGPAPPQPAWWPRERQALPTFGPRSAHSPPR
jgi:REP element-mobilizing transposase RayT